MTTHVVTTRHVKEFLKSLAPEPRRKLWRAIKELADGKGDIKQLEGKLAANWRLRVDRIRVVFYETTFDGERRLVCFFADYRATVYAVLEQLLASGLLEQLRD